jgi:drug/metabolite transporter (DMT)-like permease
MLSGNNLTLFAMCVAIWSTTWYVITFQLGPVAAEVSVAWRFLLAACVVAVFCRMRKLPLSVSPGAHLALALMGMTMFTAGYIFVYYAEADLASGLVAVGYSAGPLLAMFGMRLVFGQPLTARMTTGSLFGIAGIVLVFWPEVARLSASDGALRGAVFTILAVLVSTVGGLIAHRNNGIGLNGPAALAWSMGYGGAFALLAAVALGRPLTLGTTPGYFLSLAYLSIVGSVLAFGAWFTLIRRIGPARASYVGVMVPIVALLISTVFENLAWHPLMMAGMGVSLAGNVLVLRTPQPSMLHRGSADAA